MLRSQPSSPPARVLVVDDEDIVRRATARLLAAAGNVVVEADDGTAALQALEGERFDAILTDVAMPRMNGIELLRAIRQRDLDVPVVFLTATLSLDIVNEALRLGALSYLTKPVLAADLREAMTRAVRLGRLARAKRELGRATGSSGGAGDLSGLEATFDRASRTLWSAFQPIVRIDGTTYGYEALMRSTDPDLPHPGAVLDAAEKLDRLTALGRKMRALAAAPVIADETSGALFVNLHPRDLFDPELLAHDSPLMAIASRVVLEITERASLDTLGDVRHQAAALRECGFRLAIDDLGAGYAGLTAFATLEPEVAKLDMSLIRDIDKHATKRKLVASMASLCRDLGIVIVAEGVETVAELRAVTELGCDLVQGYLLAKPGPAFPKIAWPAIDAMS